jgi:AcrR family transcriptional regulator
MTDRSVRLRTAEAKEARAPRASHGPALSVAPSPAKQKTEAILDAARAVFSRHGFDATTVDAVAAEAGIAKGTVYLYFKSKDELYIAALVRDVERLSEAFRTEMARRGTLMQRVEAWLRARLEYATKHEDFLRIYLAEQGGMFVKAPGCKELRRIARENMTYLASIVEKAQAAGEICKLPPFAVAATIGDMARGLLERRLLGWKEFQAEDEIDFALTVLRNGIVHPKKAKKDI